MKKFQFFSLIFATAFVATTTLLVSSCSQDDDYYETEMYTLAGTRMTRSGDPGAQFEIPQEKDVEKTFTLVEKDSSTYSAQVKVNLHLTYYTHQNNPGTVTYVSHSSSQNLSNVQVRGYTIKNGSRVHWEATVSANLTIHRDYSSDTTICVQGTHSENIPF